jgi:gliding motility-associated-like protein
VVPTSTVTVNGVAVASGTASAAIGLNVGSNTITVVVTAQDGKTSLTYGITISRPLSNNATLSTITLTPATTLTTVPGPDYKDYTALVGNTTTTIQLTPTTAVNSATVTVNGVTVASGTASAAIALSVGPNTITTTVTAQDGVTVDSYVITITRSAATNASLSAIKLSPATTLTPVAGPDYADYTASVGNTTSSIQVIPTTAVTTSTVTVNGVAVASGTASAAITLNAGLNTITVVVTAQDGKTTRSYGITVTRAVSTNALLSSLTLSPATTLTTVTGPDYKDYTALVSNSTSSIQVIPTTADNTATVKVNGVLVPSGTASGAIALNLGANTITVVVTAQDGKTTLTYGITVTRPLSNNATLSALTLTPAATLTTVAGVDYKDYTAAVSNTVTSIQVTPTTADNTATVTVNGVTVASGTASAALALNVGANTITTAVTAQDGVTIDRYVITVTRAASTNASLSAIKLSPTTTLTTVAGPDYADYTASVTNGVSSVQVIATTAVTTSTITVNGVAEASGVASGAIALNIGANTITIVVTAQNGITTHTYGITITRAVAPANSVYEQVSVSNPLNHPQMMGEEINVHQGLSPNGDGINDFLLIDGIANYPDNHLLIMNRSGQLIFEAKGYDNSTKVFDGHSNKNGAMQLPGTYFYSLDYAVKGETKHKTGFIILKY